MMTTLAELEAEVLRGIGAGKFYQNLRDPETLAIYTDFLCAKNAQLSALAAVIGHLTPVVERVFGNGEDALIKSEIRLAAAIRRVMDETESPVDHVALDAVLRRELEALECLARR